MVASAETQSEAFGEHQETKPLAGFLMLHWTRAVWGVLILQVQRL